MDISPSDYQTIIDSAPEAIIVYAEDRFLFLNRFAAARLGGEAGALVGQPIMQFVHPASVELVVDRIRRLETSGEAGPPVEVTFVSRTGEVMPAEVVSVPVLFQGRKAILGLIRDISRRVETERALRESEERFGNAFRYSPHGMAFVSLDGRWLRVNQSLCDMLGYTEQELLTRTFRDVTHPEDIAADTEQMQLLISGQNMKYNRIKRYYRKDGKLVWASLAVSAVHDAAGAPIYFVGQVQDITAQRELEAEAAHARYVAGIGEAAVAVAHEMNNALTILMMNADLLAKDADPEEVPALAAEVLRAATRISTTVERLAQLADPQSVEYVGDRKMVDLSGKAAKKTKKKK